MARTTKKRVKKKGPQRPAKRRVCLFCSEDIAWVDYKDADLLKRYMSERAKIRARRVTGNCAQHQREVSEAIKLARELALLPYAQRQVTVRKKAKSAAGGPSVSASGPPPSPSAPPPPPRGTAAVSDDEEAAADEAPTADETIAQAEGAPGTDVIDGDDDGEEAGE